MKNSYIFVFGILLFLHNLNADIISEDTVLEINECYQFQDNELVRGKVNFINGFILPRNGQVIFELDDDSSVNGTVIMNQGSLITKKKLRLKDVILEGKGSIVTPNLEILRKCELRNGTISFIGHSALLTGGYFVINEGACLDVCDIIQQVAFSQIFIIGNGIKTTYEGPQSLLLSNVSWVLQNNRNVNLNCCGVHIHGKNSITVRANERAAFTIIHRLNFAPSAELVLNPDMILAIGYIKTAVDDWRLILYDSKLHFLDLPGLPQLCNDAPGGQFVIRGVSELKVEGNRFFEYRDDLRIELERQSELHIDDMNKFKIPSRFVTPLRSCYAEAQLKPFI